MIAIVIMIVILHFLYCKYLKRHFLAENILACTDKVYKNLALSNKL